jgi:hypothetical protein
MNPTATLNDIKIDCNLNVSIETIRKYLLRFGMPRRMAKKINCSKIKTAGNLNSNMCLSHL